MGAAIPGHFGVVGHQRHNHVVVVSLALTLFLLSIAARRVVVGCGNEKTPSVAYSRLTPWMV